MKKVLCFLMLLCMVCTGAWAQNFVPVSGATYKLKSNAGKYIKFGQDYTEDNAINATVLTTNENEATEFTITGDASNGYRFYANNYYLAHTSSVKDWNTWRASSNTENNTKWFITPATSPEGNYIYWITRNNAVTGSTAQDATIFLGSQQSQDYAYNDQKRSDGDRKLLWELIQVLHSRPLKRF